MRGSLAVVCVLGMHDSHLRTGAVEVLASGGLVPERAEAPRGAPKTVVVTAHAGGKFAGLHGVFEANKQAFAQASGVDLFEVEKMQADPRFRAALHVPVENGAPFKYLAIQQLFERVPGIDWAVWVDGDTWLSTTQPLDMRQLLGSHPGDFVIGTEHAKPPHGCLRYNAGVFAIRNTAWSRKFLKSIIGAPTGSKAYANYVSDLGPQHVPQGFHDQCALAMLVDELPAAERSKVTTVPAAQTAERLQCRTTYKCTHFFPHLCCTEKSWCMHVPNSDWKGMAGLAFEMEASSLVGTVEQAGHAAVKTAARLSTALEAELCAVATARGAVPQLCRPVCAVHGCGAAGSLLETAEREAGDGCANAWPRDVCLTALSKEDTQTPDPLDLNNCATPAIAQNCKRLCNLCEDSDGKVGVKECKDEDRDICATFVMDRVGRAGGRTCRDEEVRERCPKMCYRCKAE